MKYTADLYNPKTHASDCLVIPVCSGTHQEDVFKTLDTLSDHTLSKRVKSGDIRANLGQVTMLHDVPNLPSSRLLCVGVGASQTLKANDFRRICHDVARALQHTPAKTATVYLQNISIAKNDTMSPLRQWIMAIEESLYCFDDCKNTNKSKRKITLQHIQFAVADKKEKSAAVDAIHEGKAIAEGMSFAKTLGNLPANICTPSYLAKEALQLAKKMKKIKTTILSEAQMKKLGMHSLLSVSNGSVEPAKLIVMEYHGNKKSKAPIVLVGKGITFDSGGISIKPAAGMDEMKFDMCGAASVFGTLHAAVTLGLPLNIVGIVAASENLPSGTATKPGDIVKSMAGLTIEILNTDAEGRLVLCDALTYAARYKPEVVIDIATLTGAMVIALGPHPSGMMGNDDKLAHDLEKAGNTIHDRVWRLPLWEEYQDQLDSNFADMANVGGRAGGSITAACFLSRFTKEYRWAHLDIAGTAWHSSGKAKGSTGRPVPLLTQYLIDRCHGA